jgi:hypothetical protein
VSKAKGRRKAGGEDGDLDLDKDGLVPGETRVVLRLGDDGDVRRVRTEALESPAPDA